MCEIRNYHPDYGQKHAKRVASPSSYSMSIRGWRISCCVCMDDISIDASIQIAMHAGRHWRGIYRTLVHESVYKHATLCRHPGLDGHFALQVAHVLEVKLEFSWIVRSEDGERIAHHFLYLLLHELRGLQQESVLGGRMLTQLILQFSDRVFEHINCSSCKFLGSLYLLLLLGILLCCGLLLQFFLFRSLWVIGGRQCRTCMCMRALMYMHLLIKCTSGYYRLDLQFKPHPRVQACGVRRAL